jgi:hypothetical protein
VAGGWWLVAGGWWLVVRSSRLVAFAGVAALVFDGKSALGGRKRVKNDTFSSAER